MKEVIIGINEIIEEINDEVPLARYFCWAGVLLFVSMPFYSFCGYFNEIILNVYYCVAGTYVALFTAYTIVISFIVPTKSNIFFIAGITLPFYLLLSPNILITIIKDVSSLFPACMSRFMPF